MLLPMPRAEAADLVLRTRITLERVRRGEVTRDLINQLSQVVLVTNFVTEAGHGLLDMDFLERVEHGLADVLLEADRTGNWQVSEALLADLGPVVNEYDRMLTQTRMSEIARASDRLEQLIRANAPAIA
ncbi:hypothetical protein [Paraburkholderia adhaesiva]|uniref:hypothetical protein n=1 Tax=Paraburkholderia adhaesiva TaxID=2883244 RepID=UPI001F48487C|nr:hypothetical protein [Paraburkholderia adhaesiva]